MFHEDSSAFYGPQTPPEHVLHDLFLAHRVSSGCTDSSVSACTRTRDTNMKHGQQQSCPCGTRLVRWRDSAAQTGKRAQISGPHEDFGCMAGQRPRPMRWEKRTPPTSFSVCPYRSLVIACARAGRLGFQDLLL